MLSDQAISNRRQSNQSMANTAAAVQGSKTWLSTVVSILIMAYIGYSVIDGTSTALFSQRTMIGVAALLVLSTFIIRPKSAALMMIPIIVISSVDVGLIYVTLGQTIIGQAIIIAPAFLLICQAILVARMSREITRSDIQS